MKQTHEYTSDHYRRDNGFPLAWIITYFFRRGAKIDETKEEPEKYHQRHIGQGRKIIGRVAGPEAYTGSSAKHLKGRFHERTEPLGAADEDLKSKTAST